MKTNLFNTNYSAPEMKVIEVELERAILDDSNVSPMVVNNNPDWIGSDDWNNKK